MNPIGPQRTQYPLLRNQRDVALRGYAGARDITFYGIDGRCPSKVCGPATQLLDADGENEYERQSVRRRRW